MCVCLRVCPEHGPERMSPAIVDARETTNSSPDCDSEDSLSIGNTSQAYCNPVLFFF